MKERIALNMACCVYKLWKVSGLAVVLELIGGLNMACCVYRLLGVAGLAVVLELIGGFHDIVQYPQVLRVRLLGLTFDAQFPYVIVLVSMEVLPSVQVQSQWVRMAFVSRE
jgi:hypothetical protein